MLTERLEVQDACRELLRDLFWSAIAVEEVRAWRLLLALVGERLCRRRRLRCTMRRWILRSSNVRAFFRACARGEKRAGEGGEGGQHELGVVDGRAWTFADVAHPASHLSDTVHAVVELLSRFSSVTSWLELSRRCFRWPSLACGPG